MGTYLRQVVPVQIASFGTYKTVVHVESVRSVAREHAPNAKLQQAFKTRLF